MVAASVEVKTVESTQKLSKSENLSGSTTGSLGKLTIMLSMPCFVSFSVRNVGMGTSTASARVSAFASAYAPLLVRLYHYHRPF